MTTSEKRKPCPSAANTGSRANSQNQPAQYNRFIRAPQHDRRIGRGDDFAGDAWLDQRTGEIEYGAVGVDRNANRPSLAREIAAIVTIGAMTGVMFWQSVFGMADDLASGPMVPMSYSVAEVEHD